MSRGTRLPKFSANENQMYQSPPVCSHAQARGPISAAVRSNEVIVISTISR